MAGTREQRKNGIWVGPKVHVSNHGEVVHLPALSVSKVSVDIVRIREAVPPEVLRGLRMNGRSRLCQSGVQIVESSGERVAAALMDESHATIEIPVVNFIERPVEILDGTELGPLFHVIRLLRGRPLEELILSPNGVRIDGEENRDWWIRRNRAGEAIGVDLQINPETRRWYPPTRQILRVNGETDVDYRAEIDEKLQKLPLDGSRVLWIAETVPVDLPHKDMYALLDSRVARREAGERVECEGALHINALLHRRNHTLRLHQNWQKWPFRTEIFSSTSRDEMPNVVSLGFAQAT